MPQEPTIQNIFRKLDVNLQPIRRENNVFWWLAGIALAVCFLALTLHYYAVHQLQRHTVTQPLLDTATTISNKK